jgi:hypothetical protein
MGSLVLVLVVVVVVWYSGGACFERESDEKEDVSFALA